MQEELSVHIWYRACLQGIGVSKQMEELLRVRLKEGKMEYVLPWESI